MKQNLTLEALRQLLERRDMCALRDALTQTHPADLAELLDELDRPEMLAVFRALPKELAAEVFSDLPPEDQQALIQAATDQELSAIVEELWVDDAVDLLEELPAGVVKRVLQAARPDTRQLINQFLHYPENSVGSIMTAEFTDLKRDMTVAQAIAHIRRTGADSESIYTCYVTDAARRLEGVVTIRELLLAGDQALVADLMERDVITAGTGEDREEAVRRFQEDPDTRVIICSIKAAGVGLTLTAAHTVGFVELPWHGADCEQCEDRAHRIGQKDSVECVYYLGKDTIDEWIYEVIREKMDMAGKITGGHAEVRTSVLDSLVELLAGRKEGACTS